MAHLLILRGLPGSGKSTFANALVNGVEVDHFEADQYFTDDSGNYNFDATKLRQAHAACFSNTWNSLRKGRNVVVSNTFTRVSEFQSYIDLCNDNGWPFTVLTCEGNYGSVHNVPDEAIERMKDRWEHYPN